MESGIKNKRIDAVSANTRSLFLNTGKNKETRANKSIIIALSLGISGPIKNTYRIDTITPIGREK